MKYFVALAAAVCLFLVPAAAFGTNYPDAGDVELGGNFGCTGCTIHITNDTTGNMRTTTTYNGIWTAQDFITGDKYTLYATYSIGQCLYYNTNTKTHVQPEGIYDWPVLTISGTATMGGCPQF